MNNDDKILKALEDIKKTQQEHSKRLDNTASKDDLKDLATKADVERLEDRQVVIEQEIYEVQKDQKAIKGMTTLLNSNVVKITQNHETRIKNLEEHTGTTDPTKQ